MKLTTENKQLTRLAELMQSERDHLFRYACYRLGSAVEADDVVQDLYLRLSKQGARLAEIEDLKGYVYRSLTNSCTSALRSRRQFATTETLDTLSSDDLTPKDFEQEFRLIERLM
ncbi:MAG: RNA polymerase sigma factor, partial [Tidjanibacter sp.]|nr:RNA polymerase sigma factor [Tidjanibacter sp.]